MDKMTVFLLVVSVMLQLRVALGKFPQKADQPLIVWSVVVTALAITRVAF